MSVSLGQRTSQKFDLINAQAYRIGTGGERKGLLQPGLRRSDTSQGGPLGLGMPDPARRKP